MGSSETSAVTLIGDVVRSRRAQDRLRLQDTVIAALEEANQLVPSVAPLDPTVGDEFQATYPSVGAALRATLVLRLLVLPEVDLRFGVGRGPITVFEPEQRPIVQDGPGWWAAREAITQVKGVETQQGRSRFLRTWVVSDTGDGRDELVNAFLLTRDELIGQQSDRARRLTLGWLQRRTQDQLAASEHITQSAVSQQLSSSGAYAICDAHDLLDRQTP